MARCAGEVGVGALISSRACSVVVGWSSILVIIMQTMIASLSFTDLIGVVARIANLLIFVIPDLIRDPLLWGRNIEESR